MSHFISLYGNIAIAKAYCRQPRGHPTCRGMIDTPRRPTASRSRRMADDKNYRSLACRTYLRDIKCLQDMIEAPCWDTGAEAIRGLGDLGDPPSSRVGR